MPAAYTRQYRARLAQVEQLQATSRFFSHCMMAPDRLSRKFEMNEGKAYLFQFPVLQWSLAGDHVGDGAFHS